MTVFRPGTFPSYLTTPEHKIDLLREAGIELVVPLEFTEELSQVSARQFRRTARVASMRMKGLVLGPDSALGKGREGDLAYMQAEGERLGFWVRTVPPLELNGQPVKSRVVREALVAGDTWPEPPACWAATIHSAARWWWATSAGAPWASPQPT